MANPGQAWKLPPPSLSLPEGSVHVWRANLDSPSPGFLASLQSHLSPDETARAARFRFNIDRDRFIVAHGILRVILGRYLSVDPGSLRFNYGAHRKPALAGGPPAGTLCFNLSHSSGLALYAFAWDRPVGIDVDEIRPEVDVLGLAQRFFSPLEHDTLTSLPVEQRQALFFRYWTLKEAYSKARGEGLSIPLDCLDGSWLDPASGPVPVFQDLKTLQGWSFLELNPGPNFAAALVVNGTGLKVDYWEERVDSLAN